MGLLQEEGGLLTLHAGSCCERCRAGGKGAAGWDWGRGLSLAQDWLSPLLLDSRHALLPADSTRCFLPRGPGEMKPVPAQAPAVLSAAVAHSAGP